MRGRAPLLLAAAAGAAGFAFMMAIVPAEAAWHLSASDKVEHFVAFLVVAVLARLALPRVRARVALAGTILFGAVIELSQLVMPFGRTASLVDLAADALAAAVGIAIAAPLVRRRRAAAR